MHLEDYSCHWGQRINEKSFVPMDLTFQWGEMDNNPVNKEVLANTTVYAEYKT